MNPPSSEEITAAIQTLCKSGVPPLLLDALIAWNVARLAREEGENDAKG